MKKTIALLLIAALLLAFGATSALAAAPEAAPHRAQFIDGNDDGVCDVCGSLDKDGDGVCDNCPTGGMCPQGGAGRHAGHGGAGRCGVCFVDADGDGVCDNYPAGGVCPQGGARRHCGRGN